MSDPTIEAQRAFYDRVWEHVPTTQLNNHEQARLRAIRNALSRLTLRKDAELLEVGCGRGWLSGLLLREYGHVTAYDLAEEPIAKARATFPDVDFRVRDIMADPLEGTYDIVVSSEVLEHVHDQQQLVENLIAVTRPSGHLVLTTPNARLRSRWQSAGHDFTPQPIENWILPSDLRDFLTGPCVVCDSGTFFFDIGRSGIYRLITNWPARIIRGKIPLVDRVLEDTGLGLYQYAVARRL